MNDLNIPNNDPLKGQVQKIKLSDQVLRQNKFQLQIPDPTATIKAANPALILKTFGVQFLQTELYKGRIPINAPDEAPITRKSQLGTSIFSDLQFVDIGGFKHTPVDCVLFNVFQAKNIVRTPIIGRDGQIKEYIGDDDFEINIKGVICGTNGHYPFEQVSNLVEFLRYKQSLGIISQYLNNIFDITEVVVKDYAFEQTEGSYSYQKFEINCWSERPVELLIKDAK